MMMIDDDAESLTTGYTLPIGRILLDFSRRYASACRRHRQSLVPTDDVIVVVECPDDGDGFAAIAQNDKHFRVTHAQSVIPEQPAQNTHYDNELVKCRR